MYYLFKVKGLKYGSAESTRSAIKDYYRVVHNRMGIWKEISETQATSEGNPCDSIVVNDTLEAFKRSSRGDIPNRSHALTIIELEKLNNWIRSLPDELFHHYEKTKVLAMLAIAYFCWMRIDEVIQLKFSQLRRHLTIPSLPGYLYDIISLKFRKNNQFNSISRQDTWELHDSALEPQINACAKLEAWLTLYEAGTCEDGVQFEFDDDQFVFPKLTTTNTHIKVHPSTCHPEGHILKLLAEADLAIRICVNDEHLSTHCLRRGGAQHRFFEAREKWTLTAVRIWGGWSKTERTNTLVNYILNEYEAKEGYYGDMCSPLKRDKNLSILDQTPDDPSAESMISVFKTFSTTLLAKIDHLEMKITSLQLHDSSQPINIVNEPVTVADYIPQEVQAQAQVVVKSCPEAKNWRDAVKQWVEGFEDCPGFTTWGPISQWTPTQRDARGVSKALYSKRKSMGDAFTRILATVCAKRQYTGLSPKQQKEMAYQLFIERYTIDYLKPNGDWLVTPINFVLREIKAKGQLP